jgi:cobaltochelatase CobS
VIKQESNKTMLENIEFEGQQLNRWALEHLEVDKLRKLVRFFKVQRGSLISGLAIAGMKRVECVDWLLQVNVDFVEAKAQDAAETLQDEVDSKVDGRFSPKAPEDLNVPKPVDTLSRAEALLKAMCEALAGQLEAGKIDQEQVAGWVNAEVASQVSETEARLAELIKGQSRHVILEKIETGEKIDLGLQHERFEALLLRCRIALAAASKGKYVNIWLVGPAGSGKTTAAENVAKAIAADLGEPFEFEFNGALDSEHKLLGFVDANGKIVSRPFRKVWEEGGLYLFDEVDASMPGACLALNAALANGYCDFPDGKVYRSKKAVVIASGNVWNGATEDYVGRFKPDAAFSDRFMKFRWDYDEKLERAIAQNDVWVDYVIKVRKAIKTLGVKQHVVSPRASMFGALMLAGGVPWPEVVEDCVRKGLPDATWANITRAVDSHE